MTGKGATGLEALLLPEERTGYHYPAATVAAAKSMDYEAAVQMVKTTVKFSKETDYDSLLLFAALTSGVFLTDIPLSLPSPGR